MGNQLGAGVNLAARSVIAMRMRPDQMGDRLVGNLRKIFDKPGAGFDADRIDAHGARASRHDQRHVEIVAKQINVAFDVDEYALSVLGNDRQAKSKHEKSGKNTRHGNPPKV